MLDLQRGRRPASLLGRRDDGDGSWTVPLPSDRADERVAESLGSVCEAGVGLRGAREEGGAGTSAGFTASGVYTREVVPRLLAGPVWTHLALADGGRAGRSLHLDEAMLRRDDPESGARSCRFLMASRPGVGVLVADAPAVRLAEAPPFADGGPDLERGRSGGTWWARATAGAAGIAVAVQDRWSVAGGVRSLERIAAWAHAPDRVPEVAPLIDRARDAAAVGATALAAEHRATWRRRWEGADVVVDGDPTLQQAARLAVYHLLTAASEDGAAAVGPRGTTGPGYGGHVFWDADVFVLPALAAIAPAAARAVVRYRIERMPAARQAARALGFAGARFPWESAGTGDDVTPTTVATPDGGALAVRTADQEEHVVADVAWGAVAASRWSPDDTALDGVEEIVLEAARYWASRVERDPDGRGHVRDVMGPDEYHPAVDDDAFTNVMARWNLREGATLADRRGSPAVAVRWRALADALVDGWDGERGTYEQFAGYWALEPLRADLAPRPFAADLLLGPSRVAGSQIVKQPDVLMLHQLVPEEAVDGSLVAALDVYEPRTCHGSSLSPATVAGLQARAGRPDAGADTLDIAARIDLEDLTGTAAAGLHLATMGGLWQALSGGFLGLRPEGGALHVDPRLPRRWSSLEMTVRFRGSPITIRADHVGVEVRCTEPVALVVGGAAATCEPPGGVWPLTAGEGAP